MTTELLADVVPARRGRGRGVRIAALLLAVAGIAGGAVLGTRFGTDPTLVDTPLIGTVVTDQPLEDLQGDARLRLSELRGRVVVVNFWASWCTQCRAEHPTLLAAAAAYRSAGVEFVGVVYQDTAANAVGYLAEMGRGGANYRNTMDPGGRAALDMGVYGVPETFVVAPDGRVTAKITGRATFPLLAGALDVALAGTAPPR